MQSTAAAFSGEVRAKRQQVVRHRFDGQAVGKPVELGQQLRRTVDGDHARAGARQRDGVHAEARAEIDHQRARGQLPRVHSSISALPASSAASTLPDIQE